MYITIYCRSSIYPKLLINKRLDDCIELYRTIIEGFQSTCIDLYNVIKEVIYSYIHTYNADMKRNQNKCIDLYISVYN